MASGLSTSGSGARALISLRNILADVPSQDFVDEGLISDAAATRFLAELIETPGLTRIAIS